MNTCRALHRCPPLSSAVWPALLLLLLAAVALPVGAQGVWRCGGDGGVAYRDAPCPGGRMVETGTPRSAADTAAAWTDLERLQRWVDRSQRQRQHDDERLRRASARAAGAGATRAPAAAAAVSATASASKKPRPAAPRQAYRLLPAGEGTSRAAATSSLRTRD